MCLVIITFLFLALHEFYTLKPHQNLKQGNNYASIHYVSVFISVDHFYDNKYTNMVIYYFNSWYCRISFCADYWKYKIVVSLQRNKCLKREEIKLFKKKRVIMYTNFFCKHSKEIMMRFYHLPLLSIRIVTTCLPVWKQLWTSCLIYPSYFFPTLNYKIFS